MNDIVIIGSGASGLTTALYSARSGLNTLIIEKGTYGGQMMNTEDIENYSGFNKVNGEELSYHMYKQALDHGAKYMFGEVVSIEKNSNFFTISLKGKSEPIISKIVVIATGVKHKHLNVKGENEFSGRGVSYCAICDGAFFKKRNVIVVGGGDSALEEANYLTKFANEVTIVHRRDKFRGQQILQKRVFNNDKIKVLYNSQVIEITGDKKVDKVLIQGNDGVNKSLCVDGVFVYIGLQPNTEIFQSLGIVNEDGYIVTNEKLQTSIEGLFAVGDVRDKPVRQIATAVGDGAVAGVEISRYLENLS